MLPKEVTKLSLEFNKKIYGGNWGARYANYSFETVQQDLLMTCGTSKGWYKLGLVDDVRKEDEQVTRREEKKDVWLIRFPGNSGAKCCPG